MDMEKNLRDKVLKPNFARRSSLKKEIALKVQLFTMGVPFLGSRYGRTTAVPSLSMVKTFIGSAVLVAKNILISKEAV